MTRRLPSIVAFLYTAVVTYYSLVPETELRSIPGVGVLHNVLEGFITHLVAYLVMALFWRIAGVNSYGSVAISISVGGLLELAQTLAPSRYASPSDMLANTLGSIVGVFIYSRFSSRLALSA